MIGLTAILSGIAAFLAEESSKTSRNVQTIEAGGSKHYRPDELSHFALFEQNGIHINEPNDLQFMQLSVGNGIVCPEGHAGPFNASWYVSTSFIVVKVEEFNETISVSGDTEFQYYNEPIIFGCFHDEHVNENTRYFLIKDLLPDFGIDYV